jgi:hypothetical protein
MGRQSNDPCARASLSYLARRVDSVELRHRDIHDGHIRVNAVDNVDQLTAVLALVDNAKVRHIT